MWNGSESTPEIRVIRMCCRYALGQMQIAACVPYLALPIDETRFLAQLREEHVLLLVYQVFTGALKPHVPAALIQLLSKQAHAILARQLALVATQKKVSEALKANDIPHVFLKGPTLNQMLWGRRMMRYSNDLDVFVAPQAILKVHTVLSALQFKAQISEKQVRFHQYFNRITTKKDIEYRDKTAVQKVEVHWKSYATEFVLNTANLDALDDELYILYLCLHAAKHGWSRVIWLVDILAFLALKKLDIMQLRAMAKKRHITPVIDEVILLAEQWFGMMLVSDVQFSQIKKRDYLLQKRLIWGKKRVLVTAFWKRLGKRFFMNAFCASFPRQIRLWLQVFAGDVIMKGYTLITQWPAKYHLKKSA
jgi:hypothetical protein